MWYTPGVDQCDIILIAVCAIILVNRWLYVNNHIDEGNCFLCSKVHYFTSKTQIYLFYVKVFFFVFFFGLGRLYNIYAVSHNSICYLFLSFFSPFFQAYLFYFASKALEKKVRQLREQAVCPQHGFPLSSHQQGSFELLTLCNAKEQ